MIRAILVLALLLLVARAFWRVLDAVIEAAGGTSRGSSPRTSARGVELARDPVCGTFVAPATAMALTAGSTTHYFCSETCMAAFKKGGREHTR